MRRVNFWCRHCATPTRSTPIRGDLLTVATIPLGIPRAGIPKGIAEATFSLYFRLSRAEPDFQPPPPNKLSTGGWKLEGEVEVKKKSKEKEEGKRAQHKRQEHGDQERRADQMVQLTKRDEAMLDWLSVVRMADQEAVRWALAALPDGHADKPVGVRRGNQWIARLVAEGLLQRAQPAFNDRSIIWATHQGIGLVAPNLYRQTTRHEIAVAAVSARYLARGYTWFRDRRPASLQDHQVDGVAIRGDIVELVEVELTPKSLGRYKAICNSHAARMTNSGVTRVVYLGTPDATRIVESQADKFIFRDQRPRLVALATFDVRGRWVGRESQLWDTMPEPATATGELSAVELWDSEVLR